MKSASVRIHFSYQKLSYILKTIVKVRAGSNNHMTFMRNDKI